MVVRKTYAQPKMDKAAETYGKFDLGGNLLFAPGAADYNRQIDDSVRDIQGTQSDIAWENYNGANDVANENKGIWGDYASGISGKIDPFFRGVGKQDQATTDQYVGAMGQWQNPADLFKDPKFMSYVGDAQNHAFRSGQAKDAQSSALGQLSALTGTKETAQERLMREMARRKQEQNERGNREALASSLKARGGYGSGAEILGNAMSQQGTGEQRSLENMQANAGAQQRAMAALGQYTAAGQAMGAQDLQEGAYANAMDQFNNNLQQQYNNFKGQQQIGAVNAGNTEQRTRATDVANAQLGNTGRQRADFGTADTMKHGLATGGMDVNTAGQSLKSGAGGDLSKQLGTEASTLESRKKDEGFFG
jgi:hypothetical protein